MVLSVLRAGCVALLVVLTACGGGGGSPSNGAQPPDGGASGPQVGGVSTPSSVSVVTAKNAR